MIRKEFTTNDCMDAGGRATQEQVAETHCNYSATKHNGTQMTQINMRNADNSNKNPIYHNYQRHLRSIFQLLSQHLNRQ